MIKKYKGRLNSASLRQRDQDKASSLLWDSGIESVYHYSPAFTFNFGTFLKCNGIESVRFIFQVKVKKKLYLSEFPLLLTTSVEN